jgi:hypothetical protein
VTNNPDQDGPEQIARGEYEDGIKKLPIKVSDEY